MTTYLITGGCGFIGSNFIIRLLRERSGARVINLDKLTYAGNPDNLRAIDDDEGYRFVGGDICDGRLVEELMAEADYVVNFAAESHVDRSLMAADDFIRTEVYGTYTLLEAARRSPKLTRFLQVSTDEVYGEIADDKASVESDPFKPRSPYSASKVGAEMQCVAFIQAYGTPVVTARPANNLGPRQHIEKFVPLCTTNALCDDPLPVYADGTQVRDWLFVEDNCEALDLLLHEGEPGEVYNVGARNERRNIEVAEAVLDLLEKPRSLIRFVEDRQGHDRRYSLNSKKTLNLGWSPRHDFESALERTVRWYTDNRWWWEPLRAGEFRDYYAQQYGGRLAAAKPYAGGGR